MFDASSLRGFVTGVLLTCLLALTGAASAAIGSKGWTRFSTEFKLGYVSGFLDMGQVARGMTDLSLLDVHYPRVPPAKNVEWVAHVNKLYEKPENRGRLLVDLLSVTAKDLAVKYKVPGPAEKLAKALGPRRKHAVEGAAKSPASSTGTGGSTKASEPPRERKWCRCDDCSPRRGRDAEPTAKTTEDTASSPKPAGGTQETAPGAAGIAPNPAAQTGARK